MPGCENEEAITPTKLEIAVVAMARSEDSALVSPDRNLVFVSFHRRSNVYKYLGGFGCQPGHLQIMKQHRNIPYLLYFLRQVPASPAVLHGGGLCNA